MKRFRAGGGTGQQDQGSIGLQRPTGATCPAGPEHEDSGSTTAKGAQD